MLSGVILAGGDHQSIGGRNRAFLVVQGQTLLERQIREMRTCCDDITIVTNDPQPFLRSVDRDIRIITDYITGKGLLSGMHAGLALSKHRNVWLLGCHMPFPSAAAAGLLLSHIREDMDSVLPWVRGDAHPLHGVFDRACADRIEKLLNNGYSSKSALLQNLNWLKLDESHFESQNIGCQFIKSIRSEAEYLRINRETKIETH